MGNWSTLKAAISNVIKQNGNQEITGNILQDVLTNIVNVLGEKYTFVGPATPSTTPGTFDGRVFYLAYKKGVYSNFNGLTLTTDTQLHVLYSTDAGGWASTLVFDLFYEISANSNLALFNSLATFSNPPIKGCSVIPLIDRSLIPNAASNIPDSTNSGYYYDDRIQQIIRAKAFRYLYVYIARVGALSVVKATLDLATNTFSEQVLATFEAEETGWQTFDLGSNISLGSREYLGLGHSTDTARFAFADFSTARGFFNFKKSTGIANSNNVGWLNFGVGTTNTDAPFSIIDISKRVNTPFSIGSWTRDIYINIDTENKQITTSGPSSFYIQAGTGIYAKTYNKVNETVDTLEEEFLNRYSGPMLWFIIAELTNTRQFHVKAAIFDEVIKNNFNKRFVILAAFTVARNLESINPGYSGVRSKLACIDEDIEVYGVQVNHPNIHVTVNGYDLDPFKYKSEDAPTDLKWYKHGNKQLYGQIGAATYLRVGEVQPYQAFINGYYRRTQGKYIKSVILDVSTIGPVDFFVISGLTFSNNNNAVTCSSIHRYRRVWTESKGLQKFPIDLQLEEDQIVIPVSVCGEGARWRYYISSSGVAADVTMNTDNVYTLHKADNNYMWRGYLGVMYEAYDSADEVDGKLDTSVASVMIGNLKYLNGNYFEFQPEENAKGGYVHYIRLYAEEETVINVFSADCSNVGTAMPIGTYTLQPGINKVVLNYQLGPNRYVGVQVISGSLYLANSSLFNNGGFYNIGSALIEGPTEYSNNINNNGTNNLCIGVAFTPKAHKHGIYEGFAVEPISFPTRTFAARERNEAHLGYFYGQNIQNKLRGKKLVGVEFYTNNTKSQFTLSVYRSTWGNINTAYASDLKLVKRVVVTGVKKGWNSIDFDEPFTLASDEFLSLSNPANHIYTNENLPCYSTNTACVNESETDNIGFIDMLGRQTIPTTGRISGLNSDSLGVGIKVQSKSLYCPTKEEKMNGMAKLVGKKISFIGDSITTFREWIPSINAVYYPNGNVDAVEKTYWWRLLYKLKLRLNTNEAWSGSRLTGGTTSGSAAVAETRWNDLRSHGTEGEDPDIIIIHISTNDWSGGISIGEIDFTGKNTSQIKPAYCYLLMKLMQTYPGAQIYCCTILNRRRNNEAVGVKNSAGVTVADYNEAIKDVANRFGAKILDINKCGFTPYNFCDSTITEGTNLYSNDGLHPNENGMKLLEDYMDEFLFNI